jgi:hypothetical protein
MLLLVAVFFRTDVSDERIASIIKVTRIGDVEITLAFLRGILCYQLQLTFLFRRFLSRWWRKRYIPTRVTRRNIPADFFLHSHCSGNLKSYIALSGWTLFRRRNVFPMRYELSFYIQFYIHSHRRFNLISYISLIGWPMYHRRNVFSVIYVLSFYIPEDCVLLSPSLPWKPQILQVKVWFKSR